LLDNPKTIKRLGLLSQPHFFIDNSNGKDVSWRQKNDKSSDFSAKSCEKEERKDKKEAWLDRLS